MASSAEQVPGDPGAAGGGGGPEVPFGQRLYDNWALLMVLGIAIMVLVFTGWGLWELYTLPPATLP